MSIIKGIIKRLLYPNKYSNDSYIKYLVRGGSEVGEGTYFYNPEQSPVDDTSLPFIHIGSYCRVTSGVRILAHDYSYAVLRKTHHEMIRKTAHTYIGNNVFIGLNSIILMNTTIEDNVIIGAGSVVSGRIPSNTVVAGNPAKIIMSLDDYYKKLKTKQIEYAVEWYQHQKSKCMQNKEPPEQTMGWFVTLWKSKNAYAILNELHVDGDDKEAVISDCIRCTHRFNSYEDFQNYVKTKEVHKYEKIPT